MSVLRPLPRKTVPPTCVLSPLPMAASAALRAAPATCIYATSMPKRKPHLSPQNKPARTYLLSFSRICLPLAISAPPWLGFSPPSPKAKSSPKSPVPSPISARPCSNPSPSPSTNTARPSARSPGAEPSALRSLPAPPLPNPPLSHPLPPRHQRLTQLHLQRSNPPPNRPHRRTLPYPPRAPNSLSSYWLGGIHPDRRFPPSPDRVASPPLRTLPLLPPLP